MPALPTEPTPAAHIADSAGRLPESRRLRIIAVIAVVVLLTEITPLQYTMVAAGLQKIAPTFPKEGANISWALTVMSLILAASAPVIGKLSDVWGKKRIFLACGLLFIAGTLIDALTSTWAVFLTGRCLQALGTGTLVCAYGLMRDLLPRKYVPIGLAVTATGFGVSAVLAPIVGGWLVDSFQWRALFWFLLIYSAVVVPFAAVVVPESPLRVRTRIDFAGAALLAAGVALTLIYLDKGQDWGWGSGIGLGFLAGGLALLVVFVLVETRIPVPIVDMRLLSHPKISMVLLLCLFGSMICGVQNYAVAYMTQTPGAHALTGLVHDQAAAKISQVTGHPMAASSIGVRLSPSYTYGNGFSLMGFALHIALLGSVVAMVVGAAAGVVSRRIGARLPLVLGLVVFVAAGVCYSVLPFNWVVFMILGGVYGIGFGIYTATTPILITETVPQRQQGVSAGMLGVAQGVGTSIGLAVMTAFLNAHPITAVVSISGNVVGSETIPSVFGDKGYTFAFIAATIAAAIALVVGVLMRGGRTPAVGGARESLVVERDSSPTASAATT